MLTDYKMDYYNPNEVMSYDLQHTILYTFQFEDVFAQIITAMSGNVSGGSVMNTDFECGITVPVEHELTKKHVLFYYEDDKDLPYREVGELTFYYPNEDTVDVSIDECADFLIGIQIIKYQP